MFDQTVEEVTIVKPTSWPSAAQDYYSGPLDLNDLILQPAATFPMRVAGDALAPAGIFDGDLILVDRSVATQPGHIVVMTDRSPELSIGQWTVHDGKPHLRTQGTLRKITDDMQVFGVVIKSVHAHVGPMIRAS